MSIFQWFFFRYFVSTFYATFHRMCLKFKLAIEFRLFRLKNDDDDNNNNTNKYFKNGYEKADALHLQPTQSLILINFVVAVVVGLFCSHFMAAVIIICSFCLLRC